MTSSVHVYELSMLVSRRRAAQCRTISRRVRCRKCTTASPAARYRRSIPGGTALPADKPDARRGGRHTPRAAACAGLQRERRRSGPDFIGFRSVRCCASGERRRCARMSAELHRAGTLLMLRSHLMHLIVQCRKAAMPPCCAGCDPRRVVLCMCSVPFVLRGCMPRAMLPAESTLHAASVPRATSCTRCHCATVRFSAHGPQLRRDVHEAHDGHPRARDDAHCGICRAFALESFGGALEQRHGLRCAPVCVRVRVRVCVPARVSVCVRGVCVGVCPSLAE